MGDQDKEKTQSETTNEGFAFYKVRRLEQRAD